MMGGSRCSKRHAEIISARGEVSPAAHLTHINRFTILAPMRASYFIQLQWRTLVPVFGVLWGHLFLGEQLGHGLLLGGSLVLLASALITGFNPLQRWLDLANAKP